MRCRDTGKSGPGNRDHQPAADQVALSDFLTTCTCTLFKDVRNKGEENNKLTVRGVKSDSTITGEKGHKPRRRRVWPLKAASTDSASHLRTALHFLVLTGFYTCISFTLRKCDKQC